MLQETQLGGFGLFVMWTKFICVMVIFLDNATYPFHQFVVLFMGVIYRDG